MKEKTTLKTVCLLYPWVLHLKIQPIIDQKCLKKYIMLWLVSRVVSRVLVADYVYECDRLFSYHESLNNIV
jgi:hypothetical protein